jgi:hypothetical protein
MDAIVPKMSIGSMRKGAWLKPVSIFTQRYREPLCLTKQNPLAGKPNKRHKKLRAGRSFLL